MDEVCFEGEIFFADAVFGGGVEVELLEAEVGAGEGRGAVYDDFDCCAEILKLNGLLFDCEDGLFGSQGDGCI